MFNLGETIPGELNLEEIDNPSFFERLLATFDWNTILKQFIGATARILFVFPSLLYFS